MPFMSSLNFKKLISMQPPLAHGSVLNSDGWYDPRGQEPITGGISHDGPYGEALPERGTFFVSGYIIG